MKCNLTKLVTIEKEGLDSTIFNVLEKVIKALFT